MLVYILILSAVIFTSAVEKHRYDNHTLYRIIPKNQDQLRLLKDLHETNFDYDFWKPPNNVIDFVSVVSPPALKSDLEDILKKHKIDYEVTADDVQKAIDAETTESRSKRDTIRRFTWTNYLLLEQINDWFDDLVEQHPNLVTIVVAGKTHEGRDIKGIKISRGSGRRAFFLEGGMAGADWISPVVLSYAVEQLIMGDNDETRRAVNDYDWYMFPVTNPDGYHFSHSAVRTWVKSRRPITGTAAIGVDLTKNWNSHWGKFGGSSTPASNNYIGIGPFSEPETRSLSSYIETISSDLVAYLSYRSFGQRFLIPFAHTLEPMYNYFDMVTIGRRAMGSLAVRYATHYIVGTSKAVHDGATGNAADWVKQRFNPPVVATFQLRDTGVWGYVLNVNQVQPSCEETFDALMAVIREARFINVL